MRAVLPCAASTLVAGPLASQGSWVEAARTRVSVHYETGASDVPVVCVGTPEAVRLPYGVVVTTLPGSAPSLVPRRWWRPDRPTGLAAPAPARLAPWTRPLPPPDPALLLGRGAGLTPDGDDVLAGLLVASTAVDDPRLRGWRAATRSVLAARRTTAVSVGMLHAALDGWASPPLSHALVALCGREDPGPAVDRLLAVGHSSGRSLLDGMLYVLATPAREGAA